MLNVDSLISTSSITLETPKLLVNSTSVRCSGLGGGGGRSGGGTDLVINCYHQKAGLSQGQHED